MLLSKNEHEKLKKEHGEDKTSKLITTLDEYKEQTGKKYKSDYLAIKKWVVDAVDKPAKPKYDAVANSRPAQHYDAGPEHLQQCLDALKRRDERNEML